MRIKLSAWKLLCSWQRRDRSSSAPGGTKSSNFSRLIQFSTVQHCSVFSLRSVCKICYEREAARLHWTNDWTFGRFVTPKMIKMECWSQVVLGRERQIWNLLRYCFVVHVAFCLSFSRHACKQPANKKADWSWRYASATRTFLTCKVSLLASIVHVPSQKCYFVIL